MLWYYYNSNTFIGLLKSHYPTHFSITIFTPFHISNADYTLSVIYKFYILLTFVDNKI
jgi:hypothetical protein